MNGQQSDRITGSLAQDMSRRQALRLLAGAILGSPGLTLFTGNEGDAKEKRKKKPRTLTRTFANGSGIAIPPGGAANPYPATIDVSGFKKAKITDIDLTLHGYSHTRPVDVDTMLVAPDGRNATVFADVGNGNGVSNLTITLDDEAAPPPDLLATDSLPSGTYQPTNILIGEDDFDGAPSPSGAVALSTFNGSKPNGAWQLYVFDDQGGSDGTFAGGWDMEITARVKKKRKKKKKH